MDFSKSLDLFFFSGTKDSGFFINYLKKESDSFEPVMIPADSDLYYMLSHRAFIKTFAHSSEYYQLIELEH